MRRADRLFRIVRILQRRKLVTAMQLAEELEISTRTVYRDVADLAASGVPIEGEAGVGYVLPDDFDLPPLMFTADEVEALVLGTRVVETWGDPELAGAARTAREKAAAVLPRALRGRIDALPLYAVAFASGGADDGRLALLRRAVAGRRKVSFRYGGGREAGHARTVRPLCLTLMMSAWVLSAWCERREDFRTFRLDRMTGLRLRDEAFPEDETRGLDAFFSSLAARTRAERRA